MRVHMSGLSACVQSKTINKYPTYLRAQVCVCIIAYVITYIFYVCKYALYVCRAYVVFLRALRQMNYIKPNDHWAIIKIKWVGGNVPLWFCSWLTRWPEVQSRVFSASVEPEVSSDSAAKVSSSYPSSEGRESKRSVDEEDEKVNRVNICFGNWKPNWETATEQWENAKGK